MKSTRPCSIFEACIWTLSYQFAQAVVLIAFLVWLLFFSFGYDFPNVSQAIQFLHDAGLDRSFLLVGVTSLGALFVLVPLVRLRLGRDYRQIIGWRTPRHEEVIFALATVTPIAVVGDVLYEVCHTWTSTNVLQSSLNQAFSTSTLEVLHKSLRGVPYPILVVALALGPAIGEELVFRGVIGRGLVHRFGAMSGSIMTAILFAIAHVSPAHAFATLPIAFLLQFLYLKTGTIWIPVLVHFCNNLLALSLVRFQVPATFSLSPQIVAVFLAYLAALLVTFEIRRRRWMTA